MSNKFFTQRFFLDTPANRYTGRGGANFVGPFTSFWVSDSNRSDFVCDLVIDPSNDRGRGIPLRLNQCQTIKGKADGACIEFETAQAGVWIDITFAQNDEIQVGSVAVSVTGEVVVNQGNSAPQSKVTVGAVASEILDADDDRVNGSFKFKSGIGTIYIGSPTELADADFANICHQVEAGDDFEIPGKGSHSAKCVGGDNVYSLRKGMK